MHNYKNQTDKGLKEKSRSKKNMCTRMSFLVGILLILGTTLVLGASHIYSIPKLNGEELPTLDPLKIVKVNTSELERKDHTYETMLESYSEIERRLNIHLLKTNLEQNNENQRIEIYGDDDWLRIDVKNYILGDTKNLKWNSGEKFPTYDHGEIYYSPLDLELQLILSDEQLRRGLNEEYLGYYEYEDSFVSVQGYKVNVLKTTGHMSTESVKRVAIFVGDGIQYKMSGQVSKDTLIEVVNSMELSKTWK